MRTICGVQGTLGFQDEVELVELATVVRPIGSMDSVERVRIAESMVRRYARRFILFPGLPLFCGLPHRWQSYGQSPNPTRRMIFSGPGAISVVYL